jgi:hypothetical protein
MGAQAKTGDAYLWAAYAVPGSATIYFSGDLAYTRCQAAREEIPRPASLDTARDLFDLAEAGHVCLTQRRIAPGCFDYIATRTGKRMAA